MKKAISLILALSMLLSCFMCFTASAEDVVTEESSQLDDILNDITNMENFENAVLNSSSGFEFPEEGDIEVDQMIAEGLIAGEMLGISVDYLYNNTNELFWANVDVTKDDVAIAMGNLNTYLRRELVEKYGGFNLFSMENNAASVYATNIANFLGNLFYPDFAEVTIQFEGSETIDEDDFYGTIVEKSGFGDILQYNWCNQGRFDFRPLIEIWGLNVDNVLKSEFKDGYRLGKKLIPAVINKFMSEGPINALVDIINIYSKSYVAFLYDATVALFTAKISAGITDPEELKTMEGLVNLIVNNNNPDDATKLQFVTMPTKRFRIAKDKTELFLYLIIYSNINCRYKNNTYVIEDIKAGIDDDRIKSMIDVLLRGDLTAFVADLGNLFKENLEAAPDDIFTSFANTIAKFFKKIADYFDTLFAIIMGEKEFPKP
ncbi:MAG: hypothetical protein IJ491_04890 [Clostridia bacterium]|nr:hypothetical protein [Clostridia bacterium]